MLTDGAFDEVVAGFYLAAAGSLPWGQALLPVQLACCAWFVSLVGIDLRRASVAFSYESGEAKAASVVAALRGLQQAPGYAQRLAAGSPGGWVVEPVDAPALGDGFRGGGQPDHQSAAPRQILGIKLCGSSELAVLLLIHVGARTTALSAEERQCCERLVFHLATAFELYQATASSRPAPTVGTELLQRVRSPVALVDEARRVRFCNPPARALLGRSHLVSSPGGRLQCWNTADDLALLLALRGLHLADESQIADGFPGDEAFLHVRGQGPQDRGVSLYLYALRPAATRRAFGDQPLALVAFHEPAGARLELDACVVAAAFHLTDAEGRVAAGIARGETPEEIAQTLGISVNTVKVQLRAVFAKTGTARQAELVSLLATMPLAALRFANEGAWLNFDAADAPPGRPMAHRFWVDAPPA